jgi:hypothetical protein
MNALCGIFIYRVWNYFKKPYQQQNLTKLTHNTCTPQFNAVVKLIVFSLKDKPFGVLSLGSCSTFLREKGAAFLRYIIGGGGGITELFYTQAHYF